MIPNKIPTFKAGLISDLVSNSRESDQSDSSVVWNTEKINAAEEALSKGKKYYIGGRALTPFLDNKFVGVKNGNLVFEYTDEEYSEFKKCKNDIEYFAEKYCMIKTEDGAWTHFKLRDKQREYLKNVTENRYVILLSSRQVGKTVIAGIILLHYACFNKEKNILITANKGKTVQEILGKIKMVYTKLPYFLKPGVVEGGWNKTGLIFDNDCNFITDTTTENTGVGLSIDFLYADEFARIENNISTEFWKAIWPTISAINNSRCIITSTANEFNLFYDIYTKALAGLNEFKSQVIYWYDIPGRDERWKQNQINTLGSEELFNQEYGCQFQSSVNLLLDPETIQKLNYIDVEYKHYTFDNLEETYVPYDKLTWNNNLYDEIFDDLENRRFMISVDLAQGLKQDYTVLNIFEICRMSKKEIEKCKRSKEELDFLKLRQIGIFRANDQPVSDAALITMELVKILGIESVILNIEINHSGDYFIKCLQDDEEYFDDLIIHTKHRLDSVNEKMGIKITSANKVNYCKDLKNLLRSDLIEITESNSIDELKFFALNAKGSYSSQTGHDDISMTIVNVIPGLKSFLFSEMGYEVFDMYDKELLDLIYEKISANPESEYVDYEKVWTEEQKLKEVENFMNRHETTKKSIYTIY